MIFEWGHRTAKMSKRVRGNVAKSKPAQRKADAGTRAVATENHFSTSGLLPPPTLGNPSRTPPPAAAQNRTVQQRHRSPHATGDSVYRAQKAAAAAQPRTVGKRSPPTPSAVETGKRSAGDVATAAGTDKGRSISEARLRLQRPGVLRGARGRAVRAV